MDGRPTVATALGQIVGRTIGATDTFLGIPYAVAPVGGRRFLPAELWTASFAGGALDASEFGPPCHQSPAKPEPFEHPQTAPTVPRTSEDCLHLNVYRPARPVPPLLPVMVWIHGGGFCSGAGSTKWFNGSALAARGQLVVTLNYRLGPLGFLASSELLRATGATGGLNGVRDQLTALRWLQSHVGAFGGDPARVTIFGESSGGLSVCVLNASPEANGLFQSEIISSGPCLLPIAYA